MSDEELRRLLTQGSEIPPGEERLAEIRGRLTSRLTPVRALPSNSVLVAFALAGFVLICLLAAMYGGHKGWNALNLVQAIVYFSVFVLLAVLFAMAIVDQLVPGARRRIRPGWLMGGGALLLVALAPMLFQHFSVDRFVARGYHCLEFGTICAALGGVLSFFLIRRGFLTSPLQAAALTGCFVGLAGVTALAVVCPQLNTPHILVWHFGTIAIGIAAGALIGLVMEWRASQKEI